MTRCVFAMALGVGVWLTACATGSAEQPKQADNAEVGAADTASAARQALAEREKARRDWQAKLSGSRWELEVVVSGQGQPQVVESDVLTFDGGTVGSDVLAKAGYKRASYSLYPPAAQSVAWEAMQMQSREEKDVQEAAIWRGEVTGEAMQGTLIKKRTQGEKETMETFSFTGRRMAPAPEPTSPAAQSEPPAAGQSTPAVPQPSG